MEHDHSQHETKHRDYWGLRYTLGVSATLGIIAFFLLTEHRAHLYDALPYLLILACPLMHFFMHGGHGGHGGHGNHRNRDDEDHGGNHARRSASSAAKPSDKASKGEW